MLLSYITDKLAIIIIIIIIIIVVVVSHVSFTFNFHFSISAISFIVINNWSQYSFWTQQLIHSVVYEETCQLG